MVARLKFPPRAIFRNRSQLVALVRTATQLFRPKSQNRAARSRHSRRIRHARATRRSLLEPLARQASTDDHLASSTGLVRRQGLGRVPIVSASPTSTDWQKMIIVRSRPGLFSALCTTVVKQRPCAARSAISSSARATILEPRGLIDKGSLMTRPIENRNFPQFK